MTSNVGAVDRETIKSFVSVAVYHNDTRSPYIIINCVMPGLNLVRQAVFKFDRNSKLQSLAHRPQTDFYPLLWLSIKLHQLYLITLHNYCSSNRFQY